MGLPSLQAMDRAQGARIWMASEATDMRCKESIESNPGLTIRLRPFFSRISTLASPDEIPSRDCQCNATLLHPDGRSVHHQWPARRREHSGRAFRY